MRILAWIAAFVMPVAIASASTAQQGSFALQGGEVQTAGWLDANQSSGSWSLDFWLTPTNSGAPIKAYDRDLTKLMHVIIVSTDFKRFYHEHPAFDGASGHFDLDEPLPPGSYLVYYDGRPSGYSQQVFRFGLPNGQANMTSRDLSEGRKTARVDGYGVRISTLSLSAGSNTKIDVRINKDGKPARDLHPYLGQAAHAVFLNAADLSYVHVHPVTASSMQTMVYSNDDVKIPANMVIHANVQDPGTYKMWFQFNAGGSLHVASFVLSAR